MRLYGEFDFVITDFILGITVDLEIFDQLDLVVATANHLSSIAINVQLPQSLLPPLIL